MRKSPDDAIHLAASTLAAGYDTGCLEKRGVFKLRISMGETTSGATSGEVDESEGDGFVITPTQMSRERV